MPGGAAHGAQIALLEAAAAGTGQVNVVVFWEIQRRRRQRRLWIQALEIGSQAIGEGHVAPVFHGLGALDAQAGLQDQHGVAAGAQLVRDHRAHDARADDDDVRACVAVGGEFCLSHRVAPGEAIREAPRHGRRSRRRRRPPERAIAAIGGHGERVAHGLVHQRLFIGDDDGGRPASHGARVPGGDDVAGQVLQPGLPGRGHQRVGGGMAGGQRGQPGQSPA